MEPFGSENQSTLHPRDEDSRTARGTILVTADHAESKEPFQALASYSYDWENWVSPDGHLLWTNPAGEKITGYTIEELKAMPDFPLPLIYEEDRPSVIEAFHRARAGTSGNDVHFRLKRKDGAIKWVSVSWQSILDSRGVCLGHWSSIRDITDHKQMEEQVRANERFLETIFDGIQEGIGILDKEMNIVRVNQSMERWFKHSCPLVGKKCFLAYHGRQEPCENCPALRAVEKRKPQRKDIFMAGPDKVDGWMELYAFPLFDKEGNLQWIIEYVRDISQRKRGEEELRKAKEELEIRVRERTAELERSVAEMEQFAYVSSHDLQEPLRMVASYVRLLEIRYKDKLDNEGREFIEFAVEGAQRIQKLIKDLLSFTRFNQREYQFEFVDCETTLELALKKLTFSILKTQAQVTHDPLPSVKANKTFLRQVFQSLIDNAIKFRGEEVPKIHISATRNGSEWVFCIRDNGIGIEPEYYHRIFNIFQRLHPRRKYPGTGIGLALVKRIVEQHGGRVFVESKPGEGSKFYFTLPAREESSS